MGSEAHIATVRRALAHYGAALDPHAGYLLARGIKTMALRVKAQNQGALELAKFLEGHPAIANVSYPGLERHPDHEYAKGLFSGFGGMLSIQVKGGVKRRRECSRSSSSPRSRRAWAAWKASSPGRAPPRTPE